MSVVYAFIIALIIVALILIQYRPGCPFATTEGFATATTEGFATATAEGFATAAVNSIYMPACVERSTDAQQLLTRISSFPPENTDAAELRMLISKLCCYDADISSPSAGMIRTLKFQFRTSQDTEPASSFVGRCLRNAVKERDIEIVIDKLHARGRELIGILLGACPDANREFESVVAKTKAAMMTFCIMKQPTMDRPIGARDMGFWESAAVASLAPYKGISASP